jgi:hypothetical protein
MRLKRLILMMAAAAALLLGPQAAFAQSEECQTKFKDLVSARTSAIGRIQAIGEANKKKPSIENAKKACSTFGDLVSADEAVVSWMESEGSWCGVSDEIQDQAKTALSNSRKERTQTCKVASSAGAAQAAGAACNTEFTKLANSRTATLGQLNKLSAAQKKNATPQRVIQACSLLNTLVSREAALTGWISKNAKRCNIPSKIRSQIQAAAASSRKSRGNACSVAQKIKSGQSAARDAQAANSRPGVPRNFDPTVGGGGVPTLPGGGVKLPSGAL